VPASPRVYSDFRLEGLGLRHVIRVEAPLPAKHASEPWPTLLCLDGDDQFEALCQARAMVERERPLPPLLLVGVGYGASYQDPGNRRARDYTPCPIEGAPDGGGADAFLDFLITQLWPALGQRFPIATNTRGIAGHSLGALFALHALFKPAPFFNRVLASAPSIWWGERAVLDAASALHATGAALSARLFLGVGTRDSESMTGDLDLLESRLVAAPFKDLEIGRSRFAGKNHYNSIHPGFRAGLEFLYPTKS
jgi:predicted alpha/beta superfamily hydrolase